VAELGSDFENDLREAILADAEETLREEIGPTLQNIAKSRWQSYASRNGYDISHIWEDVELSVTRDGDSIELRIEWPELTALFEFGVSPHTIEGNPLLHFYWEEADQWVQTESVEWGSETGGIPESRAIRDSLLDLRRVMSS